MPDLSIEIFTGADCLGNIFVAIISAGAAIVASIVANCGNRKANREQKELDLRIALLKQEVSELCELQGVLQKWTQAIWSACQEIASSAHLSANGTYIASEMASEAARELQSQLRLLNSRVGDESLRNELDRVMHAYAGVFCDGDLSIEAIHDISDSVNSLQGELGNRIRDTRATLEAIAAGESGRLKREARHGRKR